MGSESACMERWGTSKSCPSRPLSGRTTDWTSVRLPFVRDPADYRHMRSAQLILVSLLLLLAVPVASAADKPEKAAKAETPEKTVAAPTGSVNAARAVGLTATHVTLQAAVVPGDEGSTATFEYGATTAYGHTAAANPAKLPRTGATVSASIDGLIPSSAYHVRVVLRGANRTLAGPDATFTTAAPAAGDKRQENKGPKRQKGKPGESAKQIAPVQVPKAPVLGKSVAVGPRAGTVKVRSADGKTVALTAGANVPAGSLIDATHGTVALTSALDANGNVQTAEFSGGRFEVRQSAKGDGMVDIYLKGRIGRCRAKAKTARLASTSSQKRP